jgi:hypothetical protein
MSQKFVQYLIGQLLTDRDLRKRFVDAPLGTLSTMCGCGTELTPTEIQALVDIDRAFWDDAAGRIDPRLQRWRPGCE